MIYIFYDSKKNINIYLKNNNKNNLFQQLQNHITMIHPETIRMLNGQTTLVNFKFAIFSKIRG